MRWVVGLARDAGARQKLFGALALLACSLLPADASATQLEVRFSVTGGFNTSAYGGGSVPIGGSFTLRVPIHLGAISPLSNLFTPGPATVLSPLVLFPGATASVLLPEWGASAIPFNHNVAVAFYGPITGDPTFSAGSAIGYHLAAPGVAYVYWQTGPRRAVGLEGHEVSRTIVPAPSSGSLLAFGLATVALLGGRAAAAKPR